MMKTRKGLWETGNEIVGELAPKFLNNGYKIVFCPCKHRVLISRIGLMLSIENELDRHKQIRMSAEVYEEDATPPSVMGAEVMNLRKIDSQRPLDNLPGFDVSLWHDFANRIAPINSLHLLQGRCFLAIFLLTMLEAFLTPVPAFVSSLEYLGMYLVGVIVGTFFIGILWLVITSKVLEKGYRATFKEFAPKFRSQGYNLVYIPGSHIILILSIKNSP
jgi:hypothetical protein